MSKPFHLVITDSLGHGEHLAAQGLSDGKISRRSSRHTGVFSDGIEFRIVSLNHEIRGYRPVSYQIIQANRILHRERRKLDEMMYILDMRDVPKEDRL